MKGYISIFFPILFTLVVLGCKNGSEISAPTDKDVTLEYEMTHGWTGIKTFITVFKDKSAIKIRDSNEVKISFSEDEREQIDISISAFPNYKRIYAPVNGAWMDITTYELIYKNSSIPDTVSIYEPLDSDEIPESLENLILILREK